MYVSAGSTAKGRHVVQHMTHYKHLCTQLNYHARAIGLTNAKRVSAFNLINLSKYDYKLKTLASPFQDGKEYRRWFGA